MKPTDLIAARCTAQAHIASTLGPLLLARTEAGLAGLWFDGQHWHPAALQAPERPDDPLLHEVAVQISDYLARRRRQFEIPLDLHGSAFQQAVWRALSGIGLGSTQSYSELARRIDAPRAVRAVAAAVGRNPLCIILPCHRVVGADGSLTGYAGGLERKRALLALEGGR